LELCGSLLLAKLILAVKTSTSLNCQVVAWTDSTIVLHWLAGLPSRWKTFVANRVAEIQELIPAENWHHVKSEENPADCASRGIDASELVNHSLWWNGPEWLKQSTLPSFPYEFDKSSVDLEERSKPLLVAQVCVQPALLSVFTSLNKLKRVTAYCLRFINNCRRTTVRVPSKELSPEELHSALHHWIKYVQSNEYAEEIKSLEKTGSVPVSSKISQLHPFIDLRGVLRVGGRIQKANIPESSKHQILLPHNSQLTKLIIEDAHSEFYHAGCQLLMAILQRKYWIIRARDTIRHFVRKCVVCRIRRAETAQQLMGSLPTARVNPSRPFSHCGIDYAGPFNIRPFKGRSNKTFKCYFSIFVCLATKAIHLEAVSDMSTEAFIAALKRFTARRGRCAEIYSDCGSNFVGADKEPKYLLRSSHHNSTVTHYLADKGIKWNFNPPAAPHQGGLWEAGVKSVKYHLKRVVGTTTLTLEEFQTFLCQIEACLNSRPLCTMSTDPTDFEVLTPGHFLIGEPMVAIPEPDLTHLKINQLSRWQLTQQMVQHYWRRWSAEFLSNQQQRFRWKTKRANLQVGDLVIIKDKDEFLPPTKWRRGRVTQVHTASDGCVRDATVKTANGEINRLVVKLCPILYRDEQN
jgi:hypothetical protein